jgi:hypothetical protein
MLISRLPRPTRTDAAVTASDDVVFPAGTGSGNAQDSSALSSASEHEAGREDT